MTEVWAAVPVKEFTGAKQRLSPLLDPEQRRVLAETMLEDVLAALAEAQLAGIMVNTLDPAASALARRYGARIVTEGARDGHTGAVVAMGRILSAEGRALLTMPGDIPRVTAAEIDAVLDAMATPPSFTIVPAHDELGSNAVLCAPPGVVPLRFGDNSYFPHLAAARQCGIEPTVVRASGIALDIDNPQDLLAFLRAKPPVETRTGRLVEGWGKFAGCLATHEDQ
jgi:2-phospho-L-lactate guanylyltransferase